MNLYVPFGSDLTLCTIFPDTLSHNNIEQDNGIDFSFIVPEMDLDPLKNWLLPLPTLSMLLIRITCPQDEK